MIFVPHTESRIDGAPHETTYRYGGGGFQAVAGLRGCAGARSLFTEVKYGNGAPVVAIAQGRAQTGVHTVHELLGIDAQRCR